MCAMPVEVTPELEQLVFKIGGRPEQCPVQKLPSNGADQPFHKRMRLRNVRHHFDFDNLQDPQVGSPSFKEKERIVVGTQVLRHYRVTSNGTIEHPAERHTVDYSSVHAKPDDPARVLIHDHHYPMSPQRRRLAAKQVDTPEAVLHVTQESEPGWAAGVSNWSEVIGQDASDNVFIDGDTEGQCNLLGDSRSTPGGIALFHFDNGVDEFSGRSLRTGLVPEFCRKEYAVLSLDQSPVKAQKGRWFQCDCRTNQARRTHEQGAQSCDETIGCPQIRCPLSGSIQDQKLLPDENGLCDYRTDAARARESGTSNDDMDEKDDKIAHLLMIAKPGMAWS